MLRKYKDNKLLHYTNSLTLFGETLLEINENNNIYSNSDLAITDSEQEVFGILTRYKYRKKEFVIYRMSERNQILYYYNVYPTFKECLKDAQILQKRLNTYLEELDCINEEQTLRTK